MLGFYSFDNIHILETQNMWRNTWQNRFSEPFSERNKTVT